MNSFYSKLQFKSTGKTRESTSNGENIPTVPTMSRHRVTIPALKNGLALGTREDLQLEACPTCQHKSPTMKSLNSHMFQSHSLEQSLNNATTPMLAYNRHLFEIYNRCPLCVMYLDARCKKHFADNHEPSTVVEHANNHLAAAAFLATNVVTDGEYFLLTSAKLLMNGLINPSVYDDLCGVLHNANDSVVDNNSVHLWTNAFQPVAGICKLFLAFDDGKPIFSIGTTTIDVVVYWKGLCRNNKTIKKSMNVKGTRLCVFMYGNEKDLNEVKLIVKNYLQSKWMLSMHAIE